MIKVKDLLSIDKKHSNKVLKTSDHSKEYASEYSNDKTIVGNVEIKYSNSEGFEIKKYDTQYAITLEELVNFIIKNNIPENEELISWDYEDCNFFSVDMTILNEIILFTVS